MLGGGGFGGNLVKGGCLVGKSLWCGCGGGGGWGWIQAMCWGSGPGWPCAKGFPGLRKGSSEKFLLLEWWDTLLEGLRVFGIHTLRT